MADMASDSHQAIVYLNQWVWPFALTVFWRLISRNTCPQCDHSTVVQFYLTTSIRWALVNVQRSPCPRIRHMAAKDSLDCMFVSQLFAIVRALFGGGSKCVHEIQGGRQASVHGCIVSPLPSYCWVCIGSAYCIKRFWCLGAPPPTVFDAGCRTWPRTFFEVTIYLFYPSFIWMIENHMCEEVLSNFLTLQLVLFFDQCILPTKSPFAFPPPTCC